MPKTVGVIQARLGSTRLPGKVLMELGSHTVVERIYKSLQKCTRLDEVMFAIPHSKAEDTLANFLSEKGFSFFRGSLNNLVQRHLDAAAYVNAEIIVRVPGDNPFVDAHEVDRVVSLHLKHNRHGFTSNLSPFGKSKYPDGIGAEVFEVMTLENYTKGKGGEFLEHIHLNFLDYCSGRQIENAVQVMTPRCPWFKRCKNLKLDINTFEDLIFLRRLVAELGEFPTSQEIVKWYNLTIAR